MSDAWSDIRQSSTTGQIHVRRADPGHPIDWFRGKDHDGNYLFLFQGSSTDLTDLKVPKLAGIDITPVQIERKEWGLSFRLLDLSQLDIFRALCANLMEATAALEPGNAEAAAGVVLARLKRWQDLLKARRDNLLAQTERIGLFGELLLLRDLFLPRLPGIQAVVTWRGPHRDEQDFLFREHAIEVKTQLVTSDRKLRISSAEQLDAASGRIVLCHQTLGLAPEGNMAALSLNDLVLELREELGGGPASELFDAKLIEAGYAGNEAYEEERWQLVDRTFFDVAEEFPRIRPSLLHEAIGDVSYSIRLQACEAFWMSADDTLNQVFG